MTMTYKALREASDEELIEAHDQRTRYTEAGIDYYLNELSRRETERLDNSVRRLTIVNIALVVVGTAAVRLTFGAHSPVDRRTL